jgi:hypothetical protein
MMAARCQPLRETGLGVFKHNYQRREAIAELASRLYVAGY